MELRPRIRPAGDSMLLVEFGGELSPEINKHVLALDRQIRLASLPGVIECVPSYRSLAVFYNPLQTSTSLLEQQILDQWGHAPGDKEETGAIVKIPVVYGGKMGPDLEFVAKEHDLSTEEVIALHAAATYRVYLIGFSPGFPYLGGMSHRIATPRRKTPRHRVPAGSVAIGGMQTGIYSADTPGGWNIIGRTPVKLFDPSTFPPCLLKPGDQVVFQPVATTEFNEMDRNAEPR
ncbi:MAG: 5-oxoprolinase subunit PxpB [Terriglobia bacterium]